MKHAARFLVAKFVPDTRRQEPRNVGVICWTPESFGFKFLEEKEMLKVTRLRWRTKEIKHCYGEWVHYWQHWFAKDEIQRRDGTMVAKSDEAYLEEIQVHCKDSFLMVDAGYTLDFVPAHDIQNLVEQLFEELVL